MRRLMKLFAERNARGRRSPARRRWRKPVLRGLAAAVSLGAVAAGAWWSWLDGWPQRAVQKARWAAIATAADAGFAVREIYVEGRAETGRDELLAALRLARGAPILAFDPHSARKRIEALPWVRDAIVERQLPDIVHLRLVERRPLALWQRDGKFSLIDAEGEVVPDQPIARFARLIVLVGDDAPVHAAELFDVLATQSDIARRVKAAVRVGGRRWNLHLEGGVDVSLPEDGAADAWAYLAELERRHRVLSAEPMSIDLRLGDRVVIRRLGAPPAERDRGQET